MVSVYYLEHRLENESLITGSCLVRGGILVRKIFMARVFFLLLLLPARIVTLRTWQRILLPLPPIHTHTQLCSPAQEILHHGMVVP